MLWVVRRRWWILAAGLALFLLGIEPPDPGGWGCCCYSHGAAGPPRGASLSPFKLTHYPSVSTVRPLAASAVW